MCVAQKNLRRKNVNLFLLDIKIFEVCDMGIVHATVRITYRKENV